MASTSITPQTGDPELQRDDPIFSHIVGPDYDDHGNKIQGAAKVMEAVVNGTPVTAICGYVWVPSRDPDRHPLCERCKAIVERAGDDG